LTRGSGLRNVFCPLAVSGAVAFACSASNGSTPPGPSSGGAGALGPVGNDGHGSPNLGGFGRPGDPGIITVGQPGGAPGSAVTPAPEAGTSSNRTPIHIDECSAGNAAGLSADDLTKIMGGTPSSSMRWLYPYDGTVFPRGLKAPLLMWDDGTTT